MQAIKVIIFIHLSKPTLFIDLFNLTLHLRIVSLCEISGILTLLQMRSPHLFPILLLQLKIHPPTPQSLTHSLAYLFSAY
jgi:hypothetical protein